MAKRELRAEHANDEADRHSRALESNLRMTALVERAYRGAAVMP